MIYAYSHKQVNEIYKVIRKKQKLHLRVNRDFPKTNAY